MPTDSTDPAPAPRMLLCVLLSVALLMAATLAQQQAPQGILAVTLYKAHLMALGGWGGYWLDRALFPYDRPHQYLLPENLVDTDPVSSSGAGHDPGGGGFELQVVRNQFGMSMMRRAVIVLACLVCVGLGA